MDNETGGHSKTGGFRMWIWRRMERISWTEHISNEEVLTLVGEERSLISTIRARQRNWMGHLLRGDSLQREIMEGRMEGKRGRGRSRQKLLGWMMSEDTVNSRKKLKTGRSGAIGRLDMPEGRELKEEEDFEDKCVITLPPKAYLPYDDDDDDDDDDDGDSGGGGGDDDDDNDDDEDGDDDGCDDNNNGDDDKMIIKGLRRLFVEHRNTAEVEGKSL